MKKIKNFNHCNLHVWLASRSMEALKQLLKYIRRIKNVRLQLVLVYSTRHFFLFNIPGTELRKKLIPNLGASLTNMKQHAVGSHLESRTRGKDSSMTTTPPNDIPLHSST